MFHQMPTLCVRIVGDDAGRGGGFYNSTPPSLLSEATVTFVSMSAYVNSLVISRVLSLLVTVLDLFNTSGVDRAGGSIAEWTSR